MDKNLRASDQSFKIMSNDKIKTHKKPTRTTINSKSKAIGGSPKKQKMAQTQEKKNWSNNFWSFPEEKDAESKKEEEQGEPCSLVFSSKISISEESLSIVEEQFSPQNRECQNKNPREKKFECSIGSKPLISDDSEKSSEGRKEREKERRRRRNRSRLYCFIPKPEGKRSKSCHNLFLLKKPTWISNLENCRSRYTRDNIAFRYPNKANSNYGTISRSQDEFFKRLPFRVEGIRKDMLDLRDFEFF